jgi:hypothetical protein
VRERAQNRCEYCLIHEADSYLTFEADHVIAEKHGGSTTLDNLAWACFYCNRLKGSDISSVDPVTKQIIPLFNPRCQQWKRHFRFNGPHIDPLTAAGRVTVYLLQMNNQYRVDERIAAIHLPQQ